MVECDVVKVEVVVAEPDSGDGEDASKADGEKDEPGLFGCKAVGGCAGTYQSDER